MARSETSLSHIAYQELLKQIISLEIRPGAFLQERTLAEVLGMSRTPVREALNRLEQESWVTINSRRNIEVKSLEEQDVKELFAARTVMELRGIDFIFDNRLTRNVSQMLHGVLRRMEQSSLNDYDFNRADLEFHELLSLADENKYFAEFWKRIMLENARMGLVAFELFQKNSRKICQEHLNVLKGLEKKSRKATKDALREHLDEVMNAILIYLAPKHQENLREEAIYQAVQSAREKRLIA